MKKISMTACLMAFLAFGIGCGGGQSTDTANSDTGTMTEGATTDTTTTAATPSESKDTSMAADRDFVLEAGSGGMMEVQLGKLAAANASSAKVKEFGKMMVTDHTKANTELKAVAATKNITIPDALMDKHQKSVDELKSKKGAEFDKAYVDMMVDDHKDDISKFEDESSKGNDADVKAFATKTLPVLKTHLTHITTIKDSMKQ